MSEIGEVVAVTVGTSGHLDSTQAGLERAVGLEPEALMLLVQMLAYHVKEEHPAGDSACGFQYADTQRLSPSHYANAIDDLTSMGFIKPSDDQSFWWINAEFFERI
jgi:hypothetical protein